MSSRASIEVASSTAINESMPISNKEAPGSIRSGTMRSISATSAHDLRQRLGQSIPDECAQAAAQILYRLAVAAIACDRACQIGKLRGMRARQEAAERRPVKVDQPEISGRRSQHGLELPQRIFGLERRASHAPDERLEDAFVSRQVAHIGDRTPADAGRRQPE